MALFKLPLSGDVTQWISPITSWFSGNTISINLGEAGSPETEAEILRRVGSYGRQLGKITDAMTVLLKHLPLLLAGLPAHSALPRTSDINGQERQVR
jgi:hypothetical protein